MTMRFGSFLEEIQGRASVDASRTRPSDTPVYTGDASIARRLLGWEPKYDFADTLVSVLNFWRGGLELSDR